MLDQFDENFILGFEVKIESAQADIGLGGDIGDARLMVPLARDHALGGLDQIDASLLASSIKAIGNLADLSCCLSHDPSLLG